MSKVPILIYHAIDAGNEPIMARDKGDLIYAIRSEDLGQQIKYLSDNGYHAVLLDDYVAFITRHCDEAEEDNNKVIPNLPEKPVIITFDDGHLSNYTHALPILQKYGFTATFFIAVKNVGSPDGVKWAHLREMADSGMSIQSHTMTHPFLSDLAPREIRWELEESKSILEEGLGKSVDYLALPGGRYSSTVKNIAAEAGYQAICTSVIGYNDLDSDLYSLKRWAVKRNTELSTFSSIIRMKRSVAVYHKTRYFLLGGLKKVLGNQRYVAVRERFL